MRAFCKAGLGAALLLFVSAASAWCTVTPSASLVLTSHSGGVYDYSLVIGAPSISFFPGDGFTLSNMNGVTGASVLPGSFLYLGFASGYLGASSTATTAVYTDGNDDAYFTGPPFTFGTLVVDSSVLTLGTIDYSIQTQQGLFTGTTLGPVSAVSSTPEPSSLVLLLVGISALGLTMGLVRRKKLQEQGPSRIAA